MHQLDAERRKRSERAFPLFIVFKVAPALVLSLEIENQMRSRDAQLRRIADEVRSQPFGVHATGRDPQHQTMRSPIGKVQVRVKVALNELRGVGPEVAPLVFVPEARGRNLSSTR